MHGRGCEERRRGQHMWTAPPRLPAIVNGDDYSCLSSSYNTFSKDGRKISVGDCALFKPPQDCPPFVGIIRWLAAGKDAKLRLGVNWLYRPAEVKLGKGILLEAAPNEVFYSFHKDEIPAASLLHVCKVAFLPKSVELPSGISSFVCRRVYDITNKCLWWLNDQDYIDERQKEVDTLLYKTHLEMHGTVQSGGRSPKPGISPTSGSQLKPCSDSVQNSAPSFPSQAKGKKRERVDQGSESVKRERSMKPDEGDSGHYRAESYLKSEISKITEKGGLVDSEGVEKLVQLMLVERSEKKIDLVGRSILAGVVAATNKFECLSRFVQLRGLPVFDEWLQEVHKGKTGDGRNGKDNDKSVEEFLLVLLRALDKLPVNLHALQMCNIGKSVNHLRSHKNLEIQKKARSLVDTWKKRVEAEMDAKPASNQGVSWPTRSRLPDGSYGGNRHSGGSSEVAVKSTVTQLTASKAASVKLAQGENFPKSASASPGSVKSSSTATASAGLKDEQPKFNAVGCVSDLHTTASRDEKSSSSSPSHNNSQSFSSEHAKMGGFSGKEDAKGSVAGSVTVNKNSGGSSKHRKSVNGFLGSASQKETLSSRCSPLQRNLASEKTSQTTLTCVKTVDVPLAEGNSHKLIVKIPNHGRSPARSTSGGSVEDPTVMNSRASSPVISEKSGQFDQNLKEKGDTYRATISSDVITTESWQSNDFKDVLTGSDDGDGSPAAPPEEACCKNGEGSKKEVTNTASSSSGNEPKTGKLKEASFSSINALVESCVKHSEAIASMPVGDDVGMNLLASVAAGEISKSDMVAPSENISGPEHSCLGNDARATMSSGNDFRCDPSQSSDGANGEHGQQGVGGSTLWPKNVDNTKMTSSVIEFPNSLSSSCKEFEQNGDKLLEGCEKSRQVTLATASSVEKSSYGYGDRAKELKDKMEGVVGGADCVSDTKPKMPGSLLTHHKVIDSSTEVETRAVEGSCAHRSLEIGREGKKDQKVSAMMVPELLKVKNDEVLIPSGSGKDTVSRTLDEANADMDDYAYTAKQKLDGELNATVTSENHIDPGLDLSVNNHKVELVEENLDNNSNMQYCGVATPPKPSSPLREQQSQNHVRPIGSKLNGKMEAEECTSATGDASSMSAAGASDIETKVGFDLNEGFDVDDGKYTESINMPTATPAPGSSASIQLISPLPFPTTLVSCGLTASITVAAAAKGPFVPPEDLLRNKGSVGWKGTAATSAFRPAEPRKILEMPLTSTEFSSTDAAPGKHSRPPLDIDLNIPDERIVEDFVSRSSALVTSFMSDPANSRLSGQYEISGTIPVRSSGVLDLDLNRVDEPADICTFSSSNNCMVDSSFQAVKSSLKSRLTDEVTVHRDFDLNNGPALDEVGFEPSTAISHYAKGAVPSQPSISGLRTNSDAVNFSSWFSTGNTYSAVTIPSILPERGESPYPVVANGGPQRMLGSATSATPFIPDVFRGPVLSSSPALPYPSTPFQYPVFPFGTNFPLPSATFSGGPATYVDSLSGGRLSFPTVNSQFLGPAGAVPNYPRPYIVSIPDGSSNGSTESNRKWFRQGLDLNAGPGYQEAEGRDETSFATRQISAPVTHVVSEDQARMYQVSVRKRKEPEGGWDGYKQSSWQ